MTAPTQTPRACTATVCNKYDLTLRTTVLEYDGKTWRMGASPSPHRRTIPAEMGQHLLADGVAVPKRKALRDYRVQTFVGGAWTDTTLSATDLDDALYLGAAEANRTTDVRVVDKDGAPVLRWLQGMRTLP